MNTSRRVFSAIVCIALAAATLADGSRVSAQGAAHRADDLVIDYGSDGLWTLVDGAYTLLHSVSPEHLAARDIDRDGLDDIAVDFGDAGGVWLYRDNILWDEVDRGTRHTPLAFGDLEHDGSTQLIISGVGAPGGGGPFIGVINFQRNGGSFFVAREAPLDIQTARQDPIVGDDLIVNFPNDGIWVFRNRTTWLQLHPQRAQAMVVGDFDGDGRDEIAIGFANGYGTWMYRDGRAWLSIHSVSAARIAAGDLDGNGPGYGLWIYKNFTSWELLHPSTAEVLAMADLDGNGISEVIVGFGQGTGVWIFENNSRWVHHSDMTPKQIVVAHLH